MAEQRQPSKRKSSGINRANRITMRRIIVLVCLFCMVTFTALGVRLWQLQIRDHEKYEEMAVEQQTRDVTVTASRGTIYDTNGNILAMSATVYKVILSPKDLVASVDRDDYETDGEYQAAIELKRQTVVDGLTSLLGLDGDTVRAHLEKTDSQYEVMAKDVEDSDATALREFISENKCSGYLYLTPDSKRYYPYSSLASQLIGFLSQNETSGDAKVGAYGLEALYEDELSGQSGRVVTAKNAAGTEMLSSYESYMDAVDGYNLNLNIDAKIQRMAESILAEGIETYDIQKGGFCIVMEPATGDILAMANSPTFDLNSPSSIVDPATLEKLAAVAETYGEDSEEYSAAVAEARAEQWRPRAINSGYEPGSTFKALVVAAALEEGVVSLSDTFTCTGSYKVGGWNISCHKAGGHGVQTLTQAVENSCNPALMQIGLRMGADTFWQYLEAYGLFEKTGIDIQGEGESIFLDEDTFKSAEGLSSLATYSFGQTFKVTPIQMITAFSSVINGGHLLTPHVLSSITDGDGNTVEYTQVEEKRQVISEETSAQMRAILESVVANGTGKNAYQAGYRIGGKTGTSEKRDEDTRDVIVSFMGFAPADDPKVIVLLAYDSPLRVNGGQYTSNGTYISGGNIAAPMAGRLLAEIMDYLGVDKQYTAEEMNQADVTVPNLIGGTVTGAAETLDTKGLEYRTVGSGDTITGQIPSGGSSIPGGSEVVLYLGEAVPTDKVTVPDLMGLNPTQAQQALENAGLYMRSTGITSGYYSATTEVISQSIEKDTEVERGTVVEVRFADSALSDYAPG